MGIGRLAARAVIGGLFIGHGTQKLFGWFGGPGLDGTEGMMKSLRLHPTRENAVMAGATETAGGTLVLLGMATPAATAALTGVMTTAIRTVHLPNGVWNSGGGYEYNASLIAALTALAETGPGPLSVDAALGRRWHGPWWALASLAAGVGASFATVALGRSQAPQEPPAQAASDEPDTGPAPA